MTASDGGQGAREGGAAWRARRPVGVRVAPSKHGAEAPRSHTSCVLAGTRGRP